MALQKVGMDFLPANPIELITTYTHLPTMISCYNECNMNIRCRTFVFDSTWPFVCRLYEGLITTGTMISSSSSTLHIGGLHYDPSLYKIYGTACDRTKPADDRYLICSKLGWRCPEGTYWNGSICLNQLYYDSSCDNGENCRYDIGLVCSSCQRCLCRTTAQWNGTVCVPTTCPRLVPSDPTLTSLWLLDGDGGDVMNVYNGTLIGNPLFVSGYVNQAIRGYNNTYVLLPHIDFYRRSFTVELWFYLTNLTTSSQNLFSECNDTISGECLHYGIVLNKTLHMGFFVDDVRGSSDLVSEQWYHVAFVYDYDNRQQLIYLNGLLENLNIQNPGASHVYLGQSGYAIIGGIPIFDVYFSGYIDHVSIYHRVKTAKEIRDDATLVAYYSFDCGSLFDSGPNLLHGTASGTTTIISNVNSGIQFNSSNAYFQAVGFTALGISNHSLSISLYVKPIKLTGALVHISTQSTGDGWCDTLLGFTSTGEIFGKVGNLITYGPVLPLNTWTYILQTFTQNDGVTLHIGGDTFTSGGQLNATSTIHQPMYITIGNRLLAGNTCSSPVNTTEAFVGGIAELRIYNRQLNVSEICLLQS